MSRSRKSKSRQWRPSYFNDILRRNHRNRSPRRTGGKLAFWILIVILLLPSWAAYLLLRPAGSSSRQEYYAYVTGATSGEALMTSIAQELEVKNPALLRSVARVIRLDSKLRPGRYHLTPKMSILSICKKVAYEAQDPVKLTFSSIRAQGEPADKLTAPLVMTSEELRTLLQDSVYCDSLGFTTETVRCMFLPDIHEVYWTTTPRGPLHKYEQSCHRFWDKRHTALAQEMGLTPVEVSIIASIVKKESSKTDEYGGIAGLYINRLHKGMPLQTDPTLKFASGNFTAQRIRGELLKIGSPYNTYRYKGLPPGPIRYPQMTTIDAVLYRKLHGYLYMCARAGFSGYHAFATTYAEHIRNAKVYQKTLDERGITEQLDDTMTPMDGVPYWLEHAELLLGSETLQCLTDKHILVVGLGGVGSRACEPLAHSGIGHFTLADHGKIGEMNINRQVVAFRDTIGRPKVEVVEGLLHRINPDIAVEAHVAYLSGDNIPTLLSVHHYDYILDCIDTLTPECGLILTAHQLGIPIASAIGVGARLDPQRVPVAPISETHICALTHFMRKRLRQLEAPRSVFDTPCVYSSEPPHEEAIRALPHGDQSKRSIVGTIFYMPQLLGINMAAYILQDLSAPQ